MARNFRDLFRWLLPSWLTEGEGGLVDYSLAVMKDIYLERVYQGLVARFPSYSAGDALAEIGRERGLKQGSDETTDHYVARLQAWRVPKTHRVRGTAFAALREARIAAGIGTFVRTIDAQGTEHTIDANGVEAYAYGLPWTWDPEGSTVARFWLELKTVPGAAANTYSGTAGDLWTRADGNETLGIDGVTPRRMSDIRDLFGQAPAWKPAGTRAMWAVVNLTGGVVTPDASWAYWSELVGPPGSSVQTPTRDPAFRYVQLVRVTYVDRIQYVNLVPLLDGTLYAGDPNNPFAFNAQTLPRSKRLYAGGGVEWPDPVRLPDDGDLISGVL
jgi:hypothetical protein